MQLAALVKQPAACACPAHLGSPELVLQHHRRRQLLPRLRDPSFTRVLLVTLPETTPVSQAAALQEDLRRARVEPWAWILNRSLLAARPRDPLLRARLQGEQRQVQRARTLSSRLYAIPFLSEPPVGSQALTQLTADA